MKVNIWEYSGAKRIRVTCMSGNVWEGKVLTIEDAEENEGDTEDSLVIETEDGRIIGLFPSEICNIEKF